MAFDPTTRDFPPPHVPVREDWLAQTHEPVLDPTLPIIDPHHHLWHRPAERYLAEELLADLGDGHDVRATVFVQCRSYYREDGPAPMRPVGETEFVQRVAEAADPAGPRIAAGIVCMADLMLGDAVRPVLEAHLAAAPTRLRGVRNMTTSHPSIVSSFGRIPAQRLLDPAFRTGFAHLAPLGLSYDVWAYHTQLDEVADLARAFPQTQIIVNHLGGPLGIGPFASRRAEVFEAWRPAIRALAAVPNLSMKLGGGGMHLLGLDFHHGAAPPSSEALALAFRPYVETCIEAFGAERCMFESNFPVDKGMFGYRILWNAFKRLAAGASEVERSALFSGTAARIYRLEPIAA
ncbi:amidohydrolase family protein [Roseomonas terrae]|jgi:L-fuconolactonase|uniref:Amidohydrolase family protein n=1 Tax=Neoroseomonas terrae TaxID=424799 RepID=A0ABS5EFM0_9PROT|nr:amidohydrolase family protein [Neoroseomonas terrae]MBR0649816.1 amidohydrolase family protein [Neoroseomonas terrae]